MRVDRPFDVGLYLIEELARHPASQSLRGDGRMGHRWLALGCHCERGNHPAQSSWGPCF